MALDGLLYAEGVKEECCLLGIDASSAPVLKWKNCDVVLAQLGNWGRSKVMSCRLSYTDRGRHLASLVGIFGIENSLQFCRSSCSGSVDASTITAGSSHVIGSWIWHHIVSSDKDKTKMALWKSILLISFSNETAFFKELKTILKSL